MANKRRSTKVFRRRPKAGRLIVGGVFGFGVALLLLLLLVFVLLQHPFSYGPSTEQRFGSLHVPTPNGAELNAQKNRIEAPITFEELSPAGVVAIPNTVLLQAGRRDRQRWPTDARAYLAKMEGRALRVTGYIVAAKVSGPESCNGFIDSLRDFHIWIGDSPNATKATSLVVEVTPRWKDLNPEWRQVRYFTSLVRRHAKVRVTGWLLWDEEHANEVDHSRASCWEVHPVTNFEVWSADSWLPSTGNYASN